MTKLEFDWPDEAAERVRAAQGRLALAADALRARSFDDRLTAVASVLADWTAPDSPWRRELASALADATPFEAATLTEGLESALRAWDPEGFKACAQREIGCLLADRDIELAPFESVTVLAGGSIPMPTILSSLLPLVVGSPVLLRETSKDPVTASLLSRSLAARDEGLAKSFEAVAFPADDVAAFDVALKAPCIVATGSDETLADVARRLAPSQRFVPYGHKFSVAAVGPAAIEDAATLSATAAGISLDVARWDQSGCLSPVVVYAVGLNNGDTKSLATAISACLEELATSMPRGALPPARAVVTANERSEARMRLTGTEGLLFEGTQHTVVLEVDAEPRPAPLSRFLRIMPVDSEEFFVQALERFSGHISTVSIAGLSLGLGEAIANNRSAERSPSPTESLFARLARVGVSRVTKPGRSQTPPVDWPHDGLPLFTPVARFIQSD